MNLKTVFKRIAMAALAAAGVLAGSAHAADTWWNKDWTGRSKIVLDTSAAGLETKTALANVPVLVRLDMSRFDFTKAKPGGLDLRFVSGDDKTPLKYAIELYDDINELAVIWVQVPRLEPGANTGAIWMYYGNENLGAAGDDAKGVYDPNHVAVFNFSERDGQFKDATQYAAAVSASGAQAQPSGWIGSGAAFTGKPLLLAPSASLQLAPQGGLTFSAWIKPGDVQPRATLYAQGSAKAALAFGIEAGQLFVTQGDQKLTGGAPVAGTWQHVALSIGQGSATVYLNGAPVAQGALDLPQAQGEVALGTDYIGDVDALQLSNVARSADWVRVAAIGASPQGKLVAVEKAAEEGGGSGDASYFRILLDNLTIDAWVVIAILMVMLLIAVLVMGFKAAFVSRADRANQDFREAFDKLSINVVDVTTQGERFAVGAAIEVTDDLRSNSPICKMYETGVRELRTRVEGNPAKFARDGISDASLEAIKSSIDAVIVRESQKLNSKMVLLTIAISGGPFLGLLGTVVGVMITFAAIAAAGDVNVNAIAPGIAAALMATVAGLAVAIPCLFGYNYLASRVKSITADMQVFGDEYITKIAERFSV